MNPLTNVKNLNLMNERELDMGIAGTTKSWHYDYKDSAWIFMGGLPYELTEGDMLVVFSQYGELVHINLVRDHQTGKSKGFGFLCYEDQRSTILAVDNLNGIKLCKRVIRVDHVQTYRLPKDLEKMDQDRKKLFLEGCAPKPVNESSPSEEEIHLMKKKKKKKNSKKLKKEKKSKRDQSRSEDRKLQRSRSRSRSTDRKLRRSRSHSLPRSRKVQRSSHSRSRDRRFPRSNRSRSRDRKIHRSRSRSRSRGKIFQRSRSTSWDRYHQKMDQARDYKRPKR